MTGRGDPWGDDVSTRRGSTATRRAALAAGGAGLASLAGCLETLRRLNPFGGGAWSQYRGDGRSSGRAGSGPGEDLDEDWEWEFELPDEAETGVIGLSNPVAAGGTLYLTASHQYFADGESTEQGHILALDVESGEEQWRTEIPWRENPLPPVVADGTVVSAGVETLFALDAGNGDEQWEETLDSFVAAPPKVAGGDLYVPSGTLLSLSLDDGDERWRYEVSDDDFTRYPTFPPAVGGDRVYLPLHSEIHAVTRDDGEEAWVEEVGQETPRVGGTGRVYPPVLEGGTLYAASGRLINRDSGDLAALDPGSGDVKWRFEPDGEDRTLNGAYGCPVVVGGSVYVTGIEETDGRLWRLNADDGEPQDDDEIDGAGFHVLEAGGTIYASGGGKLWTATTEAEVQDDENLDRNLFGPPALAGGRLVSSTRQGTVVAFGN